MRFCSPKLKVLESCHWSLSLPDIHTWHQPCQNLLGRLHARRLHHHLGWGGLELHGLMVWDIHWVLINTQTRKLDFGMDGGISRESCVK